MDRKDDLKIDPLKEGLSNEGTIEKCNIVKNKNLINNGILYNSNISSSEDSVEFVFKKDLENLESKKRDDFNNILKPIEHDENINVSNDNSLESSYKTDLNNELSKKENNNNKNKNINEKCKENENMSRKYIENENKSINEKYNEKKNDMNILNCGIKDDSSKIHDPTNCYNKETNSVSDEINEFFHFSVKDIKNSINDISNLSKKNDIHDITKLDGIYDIQKTDVVNEDINISNTFDFNKENHTIDMSNINNINNRINLNVTDNVDTINNVNVNMNDTHFNNNVNDLNDENVNNNLNATNNANGNNNINDVEYRNIVNDNNLYNSNVEVTKQTKQNKIIIGNNDNKEEFVKKQKINENIDNQMINSNSNNSKKRNEEKKEKSIYIENNKKNNMYNDLFNKMKKVPNNEEGNLKNNKNTNGLFKDHEENYSLQNADNCNKPNDFDKKKIQMEIFLHNQINCYDNLLEVHKRIPLWGEYQANFFFHWKKIMTLNNEELKIYILIFRSLSVETIKHLDFYILKIIIDELDELRKVHEPNYNPFKFTEGYAKFCEYNFQKSSDVYVNMNEFMQPWYMKNNNKSLDIKKFLNSLDILENQKQKSYIIQAMEIPAHIYKLCNKTGKDVDSEKIIIEPKINKTEKKIKKDITKKKKENKVKSVNTSVASKTKKRTGYYALEIDGVIASFEARKGVYYDKSRKLWRANWKENGKIQTKGFSVNEYKSVQLARQKAIEWREKKEAELLL